MRNFNDLARWGTYKRIRRLPTEESIWVEWMKKRYHRGLEFIPNTREGYSHNWNVMCDLWPNVSHHSNIDDDRKWTIKQEYKDVWESIRTKGEKKPIAKIWFTHNIPRWSLTTYHIVNESLATRDRTTKWYEGTPIKCNFCEEDESH